jgi:hypothetical protein
MSAIRNVHIGKATDPKFRDVAGIAGGVVRARYYIADQRVGLSWYRRNCQSDQHSRDNPQTIIHLVLHRCMGGSGPIARRRIQISFESCQLVENVAALVAQKEAER